jgi:hypothetical protein
VTVATSVFEEDQLAWDVRSRVEPSEYSPTARI